MLSKFLKKNFSNTIKLKLNDIQFHMKEEFSKDYVAEVETTSEEMIEYYKQLQTIRRMELVADKLYKAKKIRGFCHLYDGQEAVAVGMNAALNHKDPVVGGYRIHGHAYMRGISVQAIIAEMLGKQGGSSKGKGGSMHFYNSKTAFFGGNGIIGDNISQATGCALALKMQKNKENVAVAVYGDGAANQGQLYECANMAYLWQLPMIYFCENNNYAMGTSVERGSAKGGDFHTKLYAVPGIKFMGNDVYEVREVLRFAKEYCLEKGPIALNCNTYRYHGHSMSDPGITYRTRDEVSEYRKTRDCIKLMKMRILDNDVLSEKELKKLDKEINNEVDEEAANAEKQPEFELKTLQRDVFENDDNFYLRAPSYEDSRFVKENLVE